ncbi:MAG: hypothetical protein Q8P18_01470 [Pseudomonadota bacterium]|nr:hypothetical protein [Pseudomonadota bacterium]
MILVDTCAWRKWAIHLRVPDPAFARLVVDGDVVTHPWVVAELLLGGLSPPRLQMILEQPTLSITPYDEVMRFIRRHRPKGIGWVDVNLLVSALDAGASILTTDDGLRENAEQHGAACRMS